MSARRRVGQPPWGRLDQVRVDAGGGSGLDDRVQRQHPEELHPDVGVAEPLDADLDVLAHDALETPERMVKHAARSSVHGKSGEAELDSVHAEPGRDRLVGKLDVELGRPREDIFNLEDLSHAGQEFLRKLGRAELLPNRRGDVVVENCLALHEGPLSGLWLSSLSPN